MYSMKTEKFMLQQEAFSNFSTPRTTCMIPGYAWFCIQSWWWWYKVWKFAAALLLPTHLTLWLFGSFSCIMHMMKFFGSFKTQLCHFSSSSDAAPICLCVWGQMSGEDWNGCCYCKCSHFLMMLCSISRLSVSGGWGVETGVAKQNGIRHLEMILLLSVSGVFEGKIDGSGMGYWGSSPTRKRTRVFQRWKEKFTI